jgi:RNA polymerase sigma-70 factor (ECF subfamily)
MGIAINQIHAQPIHMTLSTEFADLYETHYSAVYHTALRITGNPADAEDVLQTVFLRVLNKGGSITTPYAVGAYFRKAAANAALDLLRRRVSHRETCLDEKIPDDSNESAALLKERLRRAIASLDHDDAMLFLLRFVEGLSNGELAELFGQEKNNIAVRLHRIRQTLQAEMER